MQQPVRLISREYLPSLVAATFNLLLLMNSSVLILLLCCVLSLWITMIDHPKWMIEHFQWSAVFLVPLAPHTPFLTHQMPPIPQQRPCCPEALLARYSGARDLSKLGTVYIQQQKERKRERERTETCEFERGKPGTSGYFCMNHGIWGGSIQPGVELVGPEVWFLSPWIWCGIWVQPWMAGLGLPGKSSRNSRNLSPDGAKVQAGWKKHA